MVPDDVISMAKACDQVIETMQLIENEPTNVYPTPEQIASQLESMRQSITALAVVQRDFLKGLLS